MPAEEVEGARPFARAAHVTALTLAHSSWLLALRVLEIIDAGLSEAVNTDTGVYALAVTPKA